MSAPRRPPPVVVPPQRSVPPRGVVARGWRLARRWRRVGAIVATVLAVVGVVGAVGLAVVAERHPGAPRRMRAVAAGVARRLAAVLPGGDTSGGTDPGSPARPGRLACTAAVTVGAPGELRAVATLGAAERATVLFRWDEGRAGARAERQAVQALAVERGVAPRPVGGDGDLAVTADGATLRALTTRAPGAVAQLAVAGTRELCVLD